MLRSILAAVLGYVVMVAVVFAGIGVVWVVLGGTGAFAGEGPEPSTIWIVSNIVSGFVAAVAGGLVAARIGKSALAPRILAGLVLVVGFAVALTADSTYGKREPVDKPVGEMDFMEAGQHAKQPAWYNWVIPLVGVAGVLIGSRRADAA